MHGGAGGLGSDDAGFGVEHLVPAGRYLDDGEKVIYMPTTGVLRAQRVERWSLMPSESMGDVFRRHRTCDILFYGTSYSFSQNQWHGQQDS